MTNPHTGRALGFFQHRVARRITGRQPWQIQDESFEYPPLEEAIQEAGLEEVEAYVLRRKNMVAQYIVMRPIMDLCKEAVRRPRTWVKKRWWEQEGFDLEGGAGGGGGSG